MSSTSSSCSSVKAFPGNFFSASARASSSSRPMTHRSSFSEEPPGMPHSSSASPSNLT